MLTPKPQRTLRAAETVLPSSDRFDHGNSFRDEYVTHWILDHVVLLFILGSRGRFLPTITLRSIESTKHLSEQEVENREKQNDEY